MKTGLRPKGRTRAIALFTLFALGAVTACSALATGAAQSLMRVQTVAQGLESPWAVAFIDRGAHPGTAAY